MKQAYSLLLFIAISLTICVCSACSSEQKITEEQAIQIVKKEYEDTQFGPIKIVSVNLEGDYYEIIWTRDSNCEGGTMKIHVVTGEGEAKHYIC